MIGGGFGGGFGGMGLGSFGGFAPTPEQIQERLKASGIANYTPPAPVVTPTPVMPVAPGRIPTPTAPTPVAPVFSAPISDFPEGRGVAEGPTTPTPVAPVFSAPISDFPEGRGVADGPTTPTPVTSPNRVGQPVSVESLYLRLQPQHPYL